MTFFDRFAAPTRLGNHVDDSQGFVGRASAATHVLPQLGTVGFRGPLANQQALHVLQPVAVNEAERWLPGGTQATHEVRSLRMRCRHDRVAQRSSREAAEGCNPIDEFLTQALHEAYPARQLVLQRGQDERHTVVAHQQGERLVAGPAGERGDQHQFPRILAEKLETFQVVVRRGRHCKDMSRQVVESKEEGSKKSPRGET